MIVKLTKADVAILRRAAQEARDGWDQGKRNCGVIARSADGDFLHMSQRDGARRRDMYASRIEKLDVALSKLEQSQ